MKIGRVTVLGAGFKPSHLTPEAEDGIRNAREVFYLVPSESLAKKIRELNSSAESFGSLGNVASCLLAPASQGIPVAGVFYGHPLMMMPGVLAMIREAKISSILVRVIPGISAADCLYAELGLDPGRSGCHNFDATDFLVHRRQFDPSSLLLLWQVAEMRQKGANPTKSLELLSRLLMESYPVQHEIFVFETAMEQDTNSRLQRLILQDLPQAELSSFSTVVVLPAKMSDVVPEMIERLGIASP